MPAAGYFLSKSTRREWLRLLPFQVMPLKSEGSVSALEQGYKTYNEILRTTMDHHSVVTGEATTPESYYDENKATLDRNQGRAFLTIARDMVKAKGHLASQRTDQELMIVVGAGGCGKSNIIHHVRQFAAMIGMENAIRVLAPHGVAAFNVRLNLISPGHRVRIGPYRQRHYSEACQSDSRVNMLAV